jgi:hypothetical protein
MKLKYKPVPQVTIPHKISALEACRMIAQASNNGANATGGRYRISKGEMIALARVAVRTEERADMSCKICTDEISSHP